MFCLLAQLGDRFWLPDPMSTTAERFDQAFYLTYWATLVASVLIIAVMVFFAIRFRSGKRNDRRQPVKTPHSSTTLELTWTIIPTAIFFVLFYFGFRSFLDIATPPDNALEIQVRAYKWAWEFTYPNGATSDQLHVPRGRPVRLILASDDVIHSLFIPAFRVKKDCVPARYNTTWFEATTVGEFDLYCAEYCGTSHGEMRTKVIVHEPAEFISQLEELDTWYLDTTPVEAGRRLWDTKGCIQCHTDDGSGNTGPSFRNLFGYQRPLSDGSSVLADEQYIRTSIVNPADQIHAGYQNVMPTYQGRLKDIEITALIEWMKSISDKGPPPMEKFVLEGQQPSDSASDSSSESNAELNAAPDEQGAQDEQSQQNPQPQSSEPAGDGGADNQPQPQPQSD